MDTKSTEEGWLKTPDGQTLYTKTWIPNTAPKARLVFLHGFSDHCNWYGVLFPTLAQEGIKVYSFDQRGWGRSVHEPSQRGSTGPTTQVMADITTFLKSLPEDEGDIPLFLMGHSMGGGETVVYAATGPEQVVSKIRGFLLESPLIGLPPSTQPWKATVVLGKLASKFLPHRHLLRKLDPRTMSRDPDVCKAWAEDSLCHDMATLEALDGLVSRTADLNEGRIALKDDLGEGGATRLWVGHGTVDGACSYDACRKWFEDLKVDDKEMRVYEGWYHKLHSEPGEDKHRFANNVASWILNRCGPLDELVANSTKAKL